MAMGECRVGFQSDLFLATTMAITSFYSFAAFLHTSPSHFPGIVILGGPGHNHSGYGMGGGIGTLGRVTGKGKGRGGRKGRCGMWDSGLSGTVGRWDGGTRGLGGREEKEKREKRWKAQKAKKANDGSSWMIRQPKARNPRSLKA